MRLILIAVATVFTVWSGGKPSDTTSKHSSNPVKYSGTFTINTFTETARHNKWFTDYCKCCRYWTIHWSDKNTAVKGVWLPCFAYESVVSGTTKIITGAPFDSIKDSAIWADAKVKISSLLEREKNTLKVADALTNNIKKGLVNDFKPAYTNLIAWQFADKVSKL